MDFPFFSIYVHIPFCVKKCNYCDFYSLTDSHLINKYLDSLSREIELNRKVIELNQKRYRTIYFGGGTPSFLSSSQIDNLFSIFESIKPFKDLEESVFEANPESIDEEKIKILKSHNINRISLGLQTTNDRMLEFLGRACDYKDFLDKYSIFKKYFDNINIDLIYGIPGQSVSDLICDLNNVVEIKPEHISMYSLEIHKNTPFKNLKIDDKKQSDFYFIIKDFLEKKGFTHYEISNFAINGRYSIHNLNYWNNGDYLGFGPYASSHLNNKRWKNISDINAYITALNNGKIEFEYNEVLSEKDLLNESLMLGLRKIEGISLNSAIYKVFKERMDKQLSNGYMEIKNSKIRIRKEYLFVSSYIISNIIF